MTWPPRACLVVAILYETAQDVHGGRLDLIFDNLSDFLYRQKGQLKLDNSIIEEFLPWLLAPPTCLLIPGDLKFRWYRLCAPSAAWSTSSPRFRSNFSHQHQRLTSPMGPEKP